MGVAMNHPLEFVSNEYRKRFFFTFLFLTVVLFVILRFIDQPLRTPASPSGIVSFELARTPVKAFQIIESWSPTNFQQPDIFRIRAYLFAAFGLGIDYLFMPVYAFALAFGTLLAAGKHSGWLKSLGAVAGYGAFAASLFDAVENYALFTILLGTVESPYPEIAFYCASIKFGLLVFGLLYALAGWVLPHKG